ncbi:porin [Azonexus sp. IMCC34839]|uniref:porin n=1 Tax=Azonexus sp. IMCC34839 TaxID=3133695 RepID=UPI00399BD9A1
MQKKIIALAIAGLASSAAFAQTNVTIYGIADVGYAYQQSAGKNVQNSIDSGLLSGSRIGFKGVEDLGNGLKALFTLEYAIAMDNNTGVGVADAPWSGTAARQQMVGLSSATLGTVVAGRLQHAGYDFGCAYSGGLAGGAFNVSERVGVGALLSCGSNGRANNAVAYISPSFGGVTVALNHARVSENANGVGITNNTTNQAVDSSASLLHVSYANGPLQVGGVFARLNASNTVASDDVREIGLGATYDFGVVKLNAMYVNQKVNGLGTENNQKIVAGVTVPVMAKGSVVAGVARGFYGSTGHTNNVGSDNLTAYNLGYIHSLSKRTKLYAGYTYVNGQDQSITNTWGGAAGAANATSLATNSTSQVGGNSQIIGFGINHAF